VQQGAAVQHYITWGRKQGPVSETGKIKKVKLSLCLTNYPLRREGVWGSVCIDTHFLDLDTSCRWVVSFTSRPLYPRGKSPRYPLLRRLGGPQSRSGRRGEEKILDPMTDNVQVSNCTPEPSTLLASAWLRHQGSSCRDPTRLWTLFQADTTAKLTEAVNLFTCIREVLVTNLGQNTGYPDWGLSWFSSGKCSYTGWAIPKMLRYWKLGRMERKERKPGRKGVHINPGLTLSLPKCYCRPFEHCVVL
jgi:hypothetical protein